MSDLGSTIAPSEQVDGATPLPSQVCRDNPKLATRPLKLSTLTESHCLIRRIVYLNVFLCIFNVNMKYIYFGIRFSKTPHLSYRLYMHILCQYGIPV